MDLRRVRQHWGRSKMGFISAVVATLVATAGTFLVQARGPESLELPPTAAMPVSALPAQGQQVMGQIRQGGPFRYDKDGTVFFNREGLLPKQQRGYYREYTVPTPGVSHRGARRIVCGGTRPVAPDACYYTEDHYASFRFIAQ